MRFVGVVDLSGQILTESQLANQLVSGPAFGFGVGCQCQLFKDLPELASRRSVDREAVAVAAGELQGLKPSMLLTVAGQTPADEGVKADFKLNLGAPPPCLTGFLPPSQLRTPADETIQDIPKDLYCKVPQGDPTAVRGARNYPCQEFPGKRAPTVQLCRDPNGYVPLGSNPWRGPPVPDGTPITDPRNILPPNNYPYIPPGVDYDPGAPVVQAPPGITPGPGPALVPPYPTQAPPVDGPPPPPLPYEPPAQDRVPPYAQPPAPMAPQSATTTTRARHPATVSYDPNRGTFIDPSTQKTAVFATGATKLVPAENWVDLMTYPTVR